MVYFCADDYGVSQESNSRIETCIKEGVLNKISVLPNGEVEDFGPRLESLGATLSLHMNLVEGFPLSESGELPLLTEGGGAFKYSFIGLLFLSLSPKRKRVEAELYKEIRQQIRFWKEAMGDDTPLSIDSHQHTHMIPLVFKTLMRVLRDEDVSVGSIRIPAEPLAPYILSPKLYFSYPASGVAKQWLLRLLAVINRRELKKSGIPYSHFMGTLFSGRLNGERIKKLLPHYLKLSEKSGRDIEICLHPGYVGRGETLLRGSRKGFLKFYFSPWRKVEYDTLISFK